MAAESRPFPDPSGAAPTEAVADGPSGPVPPSEQSTTATPVGGPGPASTRAISDEPEALVLGGGFVSLAAGPRQLGDFELLRMLGEGSFATVYLARQLSLGRLVALKVSADFGSEARTMASLEHAYIVQVFSESVDPEQGYRLLCMQYVPGTTLERIIRRLDARPGWDGRAFLEAIDALSPLPAAFDPSALRDREELAGSDGVQAACWIGARLAEALAYAHGRGVLHRDLKPANILVNPYGRPLLADFNLSLGTGRVARTDPGLFGGTLAYMAPEHIDAFNPDEHTPQEAVDERSDIYSLGMVLFELLAGRRPFGAAGATPSGVGTLRQLAAERRAGAPSIRSVRPDLPEVVDRALRRCLEPDPGRRFESAADLARAMEGCRVLARVHEQLPPPGPLGRAASRRPAAWVFLLAFLPHLLGSALNIAYNALRIIAFMTGPQKAAFGEMLLAYNGVVYPLCLWAAYLLFAPPLRVWRALVASGAVEEREAAEARRRVLAWPLWAVALSCLGWLPGGFLFPLGLQLRAGPIEPIVFARFLVSFWTAGLIALTYSYFGIQFLALRVFYPAFWVDAHALRPTARRELAGVGVRLRLFQLLAGLIPLVAAALMVGLGPEAMSRPFRLLTTALIVLGMVGFGAAIFISGYLAATLQVLTGEHSPALQRSAPESNRDRPPTTGACRL
jgi:eukaryotic-like serine/threonine-protein kinase